MSVGVTSVSHLSRAGTCTDSHSEKYGQVVWQQQSAARCWVFAALSGALIPQIESTNERTQRGTRSRGAFT